MKGPLKIVLYVILIICAVTFGYNFYSLYSEIMEESAELVHEDPTQVPLPQVDVNKVPPPNRSYSTMMVYGALFFFSVVGLALIVSHDVSHFVAEKSYKMMYDEEGLAIKDPDYEKAEQAWADNKPLEAIQLMRDYLKRHPREQHVALRIAEIYEKDLQNYLAAALEYEEVLKHKLPSELWGWHAIHLCNLYTRKLNQPEKALALLRKIDAEYGNTAAAEKARKRLSALEKGKESETE